MIIYVNSFGRVYAELSTIGKTEEQIDSILSKSDKAIYIPDMDDIPYPLEEKQYIAYYIDGRFHFEEKEPIIPEPYQPTNAEVAQMISDLQVDLIIAGVI